MSSSFFVQDGKSMRAKRIGLFGNFGTGNLGNEGSLEAMLLFLRQAYPAAELVCICPNPDIASKEHGVRTLPMWATRKPDDGKFAKLVNRIRDHTGAMRNLGQVDVLLIPGTGMLDDFGVPPLGFPYVLFMISLMARLRRVPVAFISTGAGPIRHPLSRWLMRSAAAMAAYRSYRDLQSKEFMASIGLDASRDPVYPDLAFKLPDPAPTPVAGDGPLTIGIGVMAYNGWKGGAANKDIYSEYMGKLARFAIWLLNSGHQIRILIGDLEDHSAVEDLSRAIVRETGRRAEEFVAKDPQSLKDVMEEMSRLDAIVATRFHNIVCALKVGKPTISLGYARKNDVLMEAMGLGEFCQHIESFDVELLMRQFNVLIAERGLYESTVKTNNARLRSELEQQERFLTSHFL